MTVLYRRWVQGKYDSDAWHEITVGASSELYQFAKILLESTGYNKLGVGCYREATFEFIARPTPTKEEPLRESVYIYKGKLLAAIHGSIHHNSAYVAELFTTKESTTPSVHIDCHPSAFEMFLYKY